MTGGVLLGVNGQGGISFFDWNTGGLVRRIEVEPRHVSHATFGVTTGSFLHLQVYWSDSGELVCLACEDSFYILRFERENYVAAVNAGQVEEDGVEAAFEVITDINETYASLPIIYSLPGQKSLTFSW